MAAITIADLLGRRIVRLGANQAVDLTAAAVYPIFTTGVQPSIAPSNKTIIYAVLVTPNVPRQRWDPGTCTFSIDNTLWAVSQELKNFFCPASVFSGGAGTARGPAYATNYVFNFNLTVGNADNGIATVAAYGWTI